MSQVRTFPGHLLRRAHQISAALFAEKMSEMDLTSVQLVAIVAVNENPGIDATRLTEIIDFDKATIGGVIERLERKGLLRRAPHKSDKRCKLLYVTPAGKALMTISQERIEAVQSSILEPLTDEERHQLVALLVKLVHGRNHLMRG